MTKFSLFVFSTLSLFLISGCENPRQIVKDVTVTSSSDQEDNVFATVDSSLDFGTNVSVPSIELPIKKPGEDQSYGTFRMAPTLDGLVQVTVKADLTSIFKLPGGEADLPNGTKLPLGGIVDVIEIAIDGINAEIYVSSKNGIVMLGFGIAIKELDEAGRRIGDVNIFPPFSINGVNGLAGVFSGTESGQTGVAVFTSFKSVIAGGEAELIASGAKASELLSAPTLYINRDHIEDQMFESSLPSKDKQYLMLKAFRKLEKDVLKEMTPATR